MAGQGTFHDVEVRWERIEHPIGVVTAFAMKETKDMAALKELERSTEEEFADAVMIIAGHVAHWETDTRRSVDRAPRPSRTDTKFGATIGSQVSVGWLVGDPN